MTGWTDRLAWLFDYAHFETRWHCIGYAPAVGWSLLLSNGVTWLTYWALVIPLIKVYRAHRETVGAAWLLAGSAAFIALCGTHHALYDLAFRYPAYRLMAVVDVLMAGVSLSICIAFYLQADRLCAMRPASEVDAERDAKDAALADAIAARRELDEAFVRLANTMNDLRRDNDIYRTRYGSDRAHRQIVTAIEALADGLPGGPTHGDRDR